MKCLLKDDCGTYVVTWCGKRIEPELFDFVFSRQYVTCPDCIKVCEQIEADYKRTSI